MRICIVGGGTAGWMTATTLRLLEDCEITLIESPNIPNSGVGESTLQGIQKWVEFVGIKEDEFKFLKETNATLKHSIKFTNWVRKDSGSYHYPFGYRNHARHPNALGLLAERGKVDINEMYAYHFDALKFGEFLRKNYCQDVNHIIEEVDESIVDTFDADLFVDCTGFNSLLLGKRLKEPYISYDHLIPNDSAWATHIPHVDKEKMCPYTECTAINNGWVWKIPLWDSVGTGYVYSSKHISHEDAKQEFIDHIGTDDCEFKHIPMKCGRYERTWVDNVVAIGNSGGFLEPLEGNGILFIHDSLLKLYRTLRRGKPSRLLKDMYNKGTNLFFDEFAQFIAVHYSFTAREDTPYWKDVFERGYNLENTDVYGLGYYAKELYSYGDFGFANKGFSYIATGMEVTPYLDKVEHDYSVYDDIIDKQPSLYTYMKEEIHGYR